MVKFVIRLPKNHHRILKVNEPFWVFPKNRLVDPQGIRVAIVMAIIIIRILKNHKIYIEYDSANFNSSEVILMLKFVIRVMNNPNRDIIWPYYELWEKDTPFTYLRVLGWGLKTTKLESSYTETPTSKFHVFKYVSGQMGPKPIMRWVK